MRRILVFDQADRFLMEIDPTYVAAAVVTDEINGVNALDISTTQALARSNRILMSEATGVWREYVVVNDDAAHDSGDAAFGTYHAIWSVQYDLMTTYGEDVESGGEYDVGPSIAMANALNGTSRWTVGTVTATGTATIEMFGNSAWERLQSVVDAYGGEIEPVIQVGVNRITSRSVNLLAAMGSYRATQRFEWKRNLTSISRKTQEGPLICRIIPVGKNEDVTIEDVNGGQNWIQDNDAALAYRMPDGSGGWEYPTAKVKFDIDDDRELLDYATAHITDYTRRVPTYEATVMQYAEAGLSYQGVSLGDVVQIVDYGFNEDAPLRLEGRVRQRVRNLLNEADVTLTIGDTASALSLSLQQMDKNLEAIKSRMDGLFDGTVTDTATYLRWLTDHINQYINALGGWTYIVPGRGIVTYSVEVSDPNVGAEAKQAVASGNGSVTEIRGGSIRIANTLTSSGDWDWKTVFVSGHILAELVTAARLTTGYIGNATNSNYWNLDSGEFVLRMPVNQYNTLEAKHGYLTTADSSAYWDITGGIIGASATANFYGFRVSTLRQSGSQNGDSHIMFVTSGTPYNRSGSYHWNSIVSNYSMAIVASYEDDSSLGPSVVHMGPGFISLIPGDIVVGNQHPNTTPYFIVTSSYVYIRGTVFRSSGISFSDDVTIADYKHLSAKDTAWFTKGIYCKDYDDNPTYCTADVHAKNGLFDGYLEVTGRKTRVVDTDAYGKRSLYAYETPTPTFGDIGSGVIGDDGLCIVSIDDIYSETIAPSGSYKVFLQSHGRTPVWVTERSAAYFVVEGEPNTEFDWEVKCSQRGYETERLESHAVISCERESSDFARDSLYDVRGKYEGELDYEEPQEYTYVRDIEKLYDEEKRSIA